MIKFFFFQDSGLKELKKNDVAIIFYITVTVTGQKTIRLSSSSSKCCRKVREGDQDCESIRLHGGDIGFLKPADNRNLTLIYSNLSIMNSSREARPLIWTCTIVNWRNVTGNCIKTTSTGQYKSGPIFLHDRARPHVKVGSWQEIQELGYEFLPRLHGDMALTDYVSSVLQYLHDLVGSCTIDIKEEGGNVQKHEIKFDTSLAKKGTTSIPRLMEREYFFK
ncbi:uncharacterized protein TNIN_65931 [Trichonephila inaurata madagascariensis]|uniref:Uncharacterized protein n=1 Tax=Trichonephila inaurata madagascariensis TaxID=2747483 RepID=A0A8X6X6Y1_9ARAC|nr:uncharacterized protein TNIN_65931 [Trichonephila inaurata madagascariensis]